MVVLARSIPSVSFVNSPKRLEGFDARRPIFETLAHVVNNAYGPFADFLQAVSPEDMPYNLPPNFRFSTSGALDSTGPDKYALSEIMYPLSFTLRRAQSLQRGGTFPDGLTKEYIDGLSLRLFQMKTLLEQYSDVLDGKPIREVRIKDTLAHFGTVIHEVEGLKTLEESRSTLIESDFIRAAALRAALKELGEVSAVVDEKTIVLHAAGEREPIATLLG